MATLSLHNYESKLEPIIRIYGILLCILSCNKPKLGCIVIFLFMLYLIVFFFGIIILIGPHYPGKPMRRNLNVKWHEAVSKIQKYASPQKLP